MPLRTGKSSADKIPTQIGFPYDLDKFLPGMGLFILLLAHFFQEQVRFPVVMHCLIAPPMMPNAEVDLKAVDFAVPSICSSEKDVVVFHVFVTVVPV